MRMMTIIIIISIIIVIIINEVHRVHASYSETVAYYKSRCNTIQYSFIMAWQNASYIRKNYARHHSDTCKM